MSSSSALSSSACSSSGPLGINLAPESIMSSVSKLGDQDPSVRADAIRAETNLSASSVVAPSLITSSSALLVQRDLCILVPVEQLEELLDLNRRMEVLINRILYNSTSVDNRNVERDDSQAISRLDAISRRSEERAAESNQRMNELEQMLKRSEERIDAHDHRLESNSIRSEERARRSKERLIRIRKCNAELNEMLRRSEERLSKKNTQ